MDHRADDLQQTIEETRHDIEETRASMSEKLELLEERVRDTLEETKTAVDDIVENVKDTVGETVEAVKETVDGAKSTVENIVENVKETMDDTVTMVKQSFDIRYQVDQHPWLMLGASVVTGSILANFLHRGPEARGSSSYATHRQNGRGVADVSREAGLTAMYTVAGDENITDSFKSSANAQSQKQQSWGNALGFIHEEFIDVMKGAVLSTVMGTVREMIRQNMPNIIAPFDKMVSNVSKKLGTEPLDLHTNREQTTGNGHMPANAQSPGGSHSSHSSGQVSEPYGQGQ
jgi:ElaB/YqjD/DUF883 family membrane-anchored ribosome-binding protein